MPMNKANEIAKYHELAKDAGNRLRAYILSVSSGAMVFFLRSQIPVGAIWVLPTNGCCQSLWSHSLLQWVYACTSFGSTQKGSSRLHRS